MEQLELYENSLTEFKLPGDVSVLSKLEYVDLNFNRIVVMPENELSKLSALKTIKLMNNRIHTVPEVVCKMDLHVLDVSSNPLIQPPLETCARGLECMRRYYDCLNVEERNDECMEEKESYQISCERSQQDFNQSAQDIKKKTSFVKATTKRIKSLQRVCLTFSNPTATHFKKSTADKKEYSRLLVGFDDAVAKTDDIVINDTLKVIFVGMVSFSL